MLKLPRWSGCVSSTEQVLPSGIPTKARICCWTPCPISTPGDQAGLPGFYQDQVKAGLGQLDMIKKALGYEEGSAMAEWADVNPAVGSSGVQQAAAELLLRHWSL